MKQIKILFIILLLFQNTFPELAITYESGGGRTGDQFLKYIKTKFLAEKYNLTLYLKPFPYSEQLNISKYEKLFHDDLEKKYKIIKLKSNSDIRSLEKNLNLCTDTTKNSILYTVSLKTKIPEWEDVFRNKGNLYTNFLKTIFHMLTPIKSFEEFIIPKDIITVAVHVRRGGGYDKTLVSGAGSIVHSSGKFYSEDQRCPTKFPSDIYYIEQIQKIISLFPDAPLYIYIFTDDPHPNKIVQKIREKIKNTNVQFDYRKAENFHNKNVLEDLFAIAKFDCVIHGSSNFAKIARLLGNHKVMIFPQHGVWKNNQSIIDKVMILQRDEFGFCNELVI